MKKFLIVFVALFVGIVAAHAISVDWYVDGSVYDTTTCTPGDSITPPTPPAKYGYTFLGWESYIQIEYIESTGTQYIDTGLAFPNGFKCEIEFSASGNIGCVFGAWDNHSRNFLWQSSVNQLQTAAGAGGASYNPVLTTRSKYETSNISPVYLKQNGIPLLVQQNTISYSYNNLPFYVFARNDSGAPNWYISIKLYRLKLFNEVNILIGDFIPVLDFNGVPCMYDNVSRTCFYNAGTGDFVAGPVISE